MVFDYSKGEYFHFLVMHRSISGIHVFDYQRNGHVKGAFDMLFDYVANYHVTIEWNKSKFQGFDYESDTCPFIVCHLYKIYRCYYCYANSESSPFYGKPNNYMSLNAYRPMHIHYIYLS